MSCLQTTTNEFIQANAGLAADELSWFAVQTKPRHEKKAAAELQEKGISAFLPLCSEKRQWSDRQRVVELPLFPQYVFVRIAQSLNTRVLVLRTNGITSFVGMRGMGIPIPDEQIERVQTVLAHGIPVSPHLFMNVGKRMRIRGRGARWAPGYSHCGQRRSDFGGVRGADPKISGHPNQGLYDRAGLRKAFRFSTSKRHLSRSCNSSSAWNFSNRLMVHSVLAFVIRKQRETISITKTRPVCFVSLFAVYWGNALFVPTVMVLPAEMAFIS
jgi:hypothetical protein